MCVYVCESERERESSFLERWSLFSDRFLFSIFVGFGSSRVWLQLRERNRVVVWNFVRIERSDGPLVTVWDSSVEVEDR